MFKYYDLLLERLLFYFKRYLKRRKGEEEVFSLLAWLNKKGISLNKMSFFVVFKGPCGENTVQYNKR